MVTETNLGECVTWTLTSGDVVISVSAKLDGNGNVTFEYNLVSGVADLNGFYLDIANDGGDISRLDGGNNMNGSDSDGDKLDGFDYAKELGSVGGNDADHTSGSITVSLADLKISSLAELAESEVGFRATSVGEDREDSLKLATTGELCEDKEPPTEIILDFPSCAAGLTSMTLVFLQPDGVARGDFNLDGYRTLTVEFTTDVPADADVFIDDLMAGLFAQDEFLTDGVSILKGAFLYCAGEDGTELFYYGGINANGEAPDEPIGLVINPDGSIGPDGAIDGSYSAALGADGFEFTELTSDLFV